MLHTNFQGHRPFDSIEEEFKGFEHIWALRSSWSCDLDPLNKCSSPIPRRLHMKFGFGFGCAMRP